MDYVGDVYEFAGTRSVVSQQGGSLVGNASVIVNAEPAFVYVGSTVPPVLPAQWVQEVSITRWRGQIWEMAVVTVPTS